MIVNGLDTTRTYTADEVVELYRKGTLKELTLRGWLFRAGLEGQMQLVHWTDPTANRMTPDSAGGKRKRAYEIPDPLPGMKEAVNSDSPIRKRTPQERLASMTAKLSGGERGQDAAANMLLAMLAGNAGMDGLSDEQARAISGASWKGGDPIDAETVRRVAANYLGEAERKVAEQAREANTKAGRKARREQERLEKQERRAWERRQKALDRQGELTKKYL